LPHGPRQSIRTLGRPRHRSAAECRALRPGRAQARRHRHPPLRPAGGSMRPARRPELKSTAV